LRVTDAALAQAAAAGMDDVEVTVDDGKLLVRADPDRDALLTIQLGEAEAAIGGWPETHSHAAVGAPGERSDGVVSPRCPGTRDLEHRPLTSQTLPSVGRVLVIPHKERSIWISRTIFGGVGQPRRHRASL
jgi:hypothetical protein